MDRISELFQHLSLPAIARVLRYTALFSIAAGAIALGVSAALSRPLVGLGVVIGLVLGIANIRLVVRSVTKVSAEHPESPRRVLASNTLLRLLATTAVVIALLFASVELAFGTLGGIAVYYFLLLVGLVRSLLTSGAGSVPV